MDHLTPVKTGLLVERQALSACRVKVRRSLSIYQPPPLPRLSKASASLPPCPPPTAASPKPPPLPLSLLLDLLLLGAHLSWWFALRLAVSPRHPKLSTSSLSFLILEPCSVRRGVHCGSLITTLNYNHRHPFFYFLDTRIWKASHISTG